jgi:zinc/manganese transport system permease protein
VLFGTILAIDAPALTQIGAITSLTLIVLAVIYRPLVAECFDPGFLRAVGGRGPVYHVAFLLMVVLNLVASFQALGTLMAVGLMMLPAAIAQLWARNLPSMLLVAVGSALVSGYLGLIASYHLEIASGPTIIMTAAILYGISIFIAPSGLARRYFPRPHLKG